MQPVMEEEIRRRVQLQLESARSEELQNPFLVRALAVLIELLQEARQDRLLSQADRQDGILRQLMNALAETQNAHSRMLNEIATILGQQMASQMASGTRPPPKPEPAPGGSSAGVAGALTPSVLFRNIPRNDQGKLVRCGKCHGCYIVATNSRSRAHCEQWGRLFDEDCKEPKAEIAVDKSDRADKADKSKKADKADKADSEERSKRKRKREEKKKPLREAPDNEPLGKGPKGPGSPDGDGMGGLLEVSWW